jgi:hypothetical protein
MQSRRERCFCLMMRVNTASVLVSWSNQIPISQEKKISLYLFEVICFSSIQSFNFSLILKPKETIQSLPHLLKRNKINWLPPYGVAPTSSDGETWSLGENIVMRFFCLPNLHLQTNWCSNMQCSQFAQNLIGRYVYAQNWSYGY